MRPIGSTGRRPSALRPASARPVKPPSPHAIVARGGLVLSLELEGRGRDRAGLAGAPGHGLRDNIALLARPLFLASEPREFSGAQDSVGWRELASQRSPHGRPRQPSSGSPGQRARTHERGRPDHVRLEPVPPFGILAYGENGSLEQAYSAPKPCWRPSGQGKAGLVMARRFFRGWRARLTFQAQPLCRGARASNLWLDSNRPKDATASDRAPSPEATWFMHNVVLRTRMRDRCVLWLQR